MKTRYLSTELVHRLVLSRANPDELGALSQIFSAVGSALSPDQILFQLCLAGGHGIGNWARGEGVGYSELLADVCSNLKIDGLPSRSEIMAVGLNLCEIDERGALPQIAEPVRSTWITAMNSFLLTLERALLNKVAVDAYARLAPKQREEVDRKLAELVSRSRFGGLASSGAALALANAGGLPHTLLCRPLSAQQRLVRQASGCTRQPLPFFTF